MENEKQILEAEIQRVFDEYYSQQPEEDEHSSLFFDTSCDTDETAADEVILGPADLLVRRNFIFTNR